MSDYSNRRQQKVDLPQLIKELIDGIELIDGDNKTTRSVKTKAITRLATSIKNKLHDDKRRKAGDKIAPSTYRKYLTNIRRAVTEKNWVHHSLDKQISTLSKRYPDYKEQLESLSGMDITPLRESWAVLLNVIKKAGDNDAHSDIKSMKLDHEVMRHLTMPSATKENLEDEQAENRYKKISRQVTINHSWLISNIFDLLTKKGRVLGGESVFTYNQLALGLALSTGRRQIEILYQGEIKKVSDHQVKFVGQAKKRGGANYSNENIIYTLVDAQLVVDAWNKLRAMPEIKDLVQFESLGEVARNAAINSRCASNLNSLIKRVFGDKSWVFKDSRDIWARSVHDLHYAEWRNKTNKSEDLFWQEMLGHEDEKTQIGYKKFHIIYDEETIEPIESSCRLDGITLLDDDSEIARRSAMLKIHVWVKSQLTEDDNAIITQSRISREIGSSRGAIKDYLALAENALNGAPVNVDPSSQAPKIEIIEEVQPEPEKKEQAKPHFKTNMSKPGVWEVILTIGDKIHKWQGKAENQIDAMKKSYAQFQQNDLM